MKSRIKNYIIPSLLLLASSAFAQPETNTKSKSIGWSWSVGLNAISFDSNINEQGLGETAWGLELAGNYYFTPVLAASAGFGITNFDDDDEFSQQVLVTDIFGSNVETLESTTTSVPLFAELFYQSPRSANNLGFRVGSGYTHFLRPKREISNCDNCRSDELSVDGGLYLLASGFYTLQSSTKIGLSAKQYLSGDSENNIMLWAEFFR